jgi:hypothetical protein
MKYKPVIITQEQIDEARKIFLKNDGLIKKLPDEIVVSSLNPVGGIENPYESLRGIDTSAEGCYALY